MKLRSILLAITIVVAPTCFAQEKEYVAFARKSDLWGLIHPNGNLVTEVKYEKVSDFVNGVAKVKVNGEWGYLLANGTEIQINGQVKKLDNFYDGCAAFLSETGLWGYVDINGQKIISPEFEATKGFKEGKAWVKQEGKWGMIDKSGAWIIKNLFTKFKYFKNEVALIAIDGKWGSISETGAVIIQPKFQDLKDFYSNELAWAKENDKWGCINKKGEWVIQPKYSKVKGFFQHGYAQFFENNLVGLMDSTGNIVAPAKYAEIKAVIKGYAPVSVSISEKYLTKKGKEKKRVVRKWTFVDIQGKELTEPKFKKVQYFTSGYARVLTFEGVTALINQKGEILLEGNYDAFGPFLNGICVITKEDHKGFLSLDLVEIASPIYQNVKPFVGELARVNSNGVWGYIDREGRTVVEPVYERCVDFIDDPRWSLGRKCDYDHWLVQISRGMSSSMPKTATAGAGLSSAVARGLSSSGALGLMDKTTHMNISIATAKLSGKYGFINTEGKLVVPFEYSNITQWVNGMAFIVKNGYYGVVNTKGEILLPAITWTKIMDFQEVCD